MNTQTIRAITLSLLMFAGLALGLVAFLIFGGGTREAFLYLGSGTAALSLVLLIQTLRPGHELKKVVPRAEEDAVGLLDHEDDLESYWQRLSGR